MSGCVIKTTLLSLALLTFSGCSAEGRGNVIMYKTPENEISLNKNCVKNVKLRESKDSTSLFFDIENSVNCSKKLNTFFRDNMGSEVTAFYGGSTVLVTTKIVSELKTENGFSQSAPNKEIAEKILSNYTR